MSLLPPPPDPLLTHVDSARRAFDEQFAALGEALGKQAAKTRRDLLNQLGQSLRRVSVFRNEAEWISAVLDAAAPFFFRGVFFTVFNGKLEWKAARNVEVPPGTSVALEDARAFAEAVSSGEPVIALKTRAELSGPLSDRLGEEPAERFTLVPIAVNGRVAALLYAEDAELPGLELVTQMAGLALTVQQTKGASSGTVMLQQIAQAADEDDLRAQRFARSRVSEIRLHESEKVQQGREQRNLYTLLRERIDSAREAYRNQFGSGPSHLDREIVRVLANGDRELLGPDFPEA